jgi:surface antigen/LysM repeat protein
MLAGVVGFILRSPSNGPTSINSIVSANSATATTGALDQLSSADIAVHVARLTNLPEAPSVTNRADTVNAQLAVTPADDTVIAKPQVVATSLKSYKDIHTYVTVQGDTIPNVAAKFNVTSDTVRWSNGLQGDNLSPGLTLVISPVNGIVYTVKAGDTVDSIAAKYRANKDQIIADNDVDVRGLIVGTRILIRDGSEAPVAVAPVARGAVYGSGFAWGGSGAIYQGGANGYDYGYCTWWAAKRRADIGRPVPSNLGNASTWKTLAQRAGFAVGSVPQGGAVIWTPPRDWYGHVGFVESVNADGSVNISEMNVAGWGVVSRKTISAAEAAGYSYIY